MGFRFSNNLIVPFGLIALAIGSLRVAAAEKKEARLTRVMEDVQLVDANVARPALVNDCVGEGTEVRTRANSRAELTFSDQTIARLGANAVFKFKDGARNLDLAEGAVLIQVPKNDRGAKIRTASVAAALTGTTVVFEYHPAVYKFLVLDGTGRLYRPGHVGDSVLVSAGQMAFGNPNNALSDPVDFDIGHFLKTCRFITDFSPLHSEKLMASESQRQQREKSKKILMDTNLVIFGGGTLVSIVDPGQSNAIDEVTAAPATISSPAPASNPTPAAKKRRSDR